MNDVTLLTSYIPETLDVRYERIDAQRWKIHINDRFVGYVRIRECTEYDKRYQPISKRHEMLYRGQNKHSGRGAISVNKDYTITLRDVQTYLHYAIKDYMPE